MIRDALAEDLPAINDIYNATIPSRMSTADLLPTTVQQRGAWFIAHSPERRPLWVVEDEGEIQAWLSFKDYNPRPAYAPSAEVSVYVHPQQRRQGLGRQLLARAIEAAPGLGLSTLLAVVFAHNQPSATLFTSAGFEQWGRLPGVARLDGDDADVLILGLRVRRG